MSLEQLEIESIRKEVEVARPPVEAFDVFTKGISGWWPKHKYSVSQERTQEVVLEPIQGGALYEVRDDGERFPWGEVLAWERPHRLVLSWHPGHDPSCSQEVEVRFEPVAGGTRVRLEHRNWQKLGERALKSRAGYDSGWNFVFGKCFAEACAA